MSLTKHDIWEMSRDISCYLAGDSSKREAAHRAQQSQAQLTEEERAPLREYSAELSEMVQLVQAEVASAVDEILLLNELSEDIATWREADLLKYLAAAQTYEKRELIISAVLVRPNVELIFEQVEPAYDE